MKLSVKPTVRLQKFWIEYLSLFLLSLLIVVSAPALAKELRPQEQPAPESERTDLMPFLRGLEKVPPANGPSSCLQKMSCSYSEDLVGLIAYAAVSSPSVAQSAAELTGAEAGFEQSRWAFAPTPSVSVDNALNRSADDVALNMDQPLWTGGQLTANLDKSRSQVDYARANVRVTQFQLAQTTIETYGNWLSAWLRYQAWEEGVRAHDELVALVGRRVEGGASGQNELLLAQNRRESVQSEVISTQASRALALAQMEQLLGQRPNEAAMTKRAAHPRDISKEITALTALTDQSLQINPFVKRALHNLAIAEANHRSVKAGIMPTLSLRYQYLMEDAFTGNSDNTSTLMFRLSSNFGPGLSKMAQRDQSTAEIKAAKEALASVRRDVLEQIWSTYTLLQNAERRITTLERLAGGSEDLFDSYKRQFRSGKRSWVDVMNSAQEVANITSMLADARATRVTTSWKLALYLQGLDALLANLNQTNRS